MVIKSSFQGGLGDCWFLSALSSLAQPLPEGSPLKIKEVAVNRVLQTEHNTTEEAKSTGIYRFKFFRLGEFVDVVIDDQLPARRRAQPSEANEWWVPLCEKAYAKFSGSYNKIIGGNTCWALSELTGGITVEMKVKFERNFVLCFRKHGYILYIIYSIYYIPWSMVIITPCSENITVETQKTVTIYIFCLNHLYYRGLDGI